MAACGLAAGMALNTTVAPFILRGVTLGRQTPLFLSEKPSEWIVLVMVNSSVPDPYVFEPPGAVSHKYGSGCGSGSFPFPIKVLSGLK